LSSRLRLRVEDWTKRRWSWDSSKNILVL